MSEARELVLREVQKHNEESFELSIDSLKIRIRLGEDPSDLAVEIKRLRDEIVNHTINHALDPIAESLSHGFSWLETLIDDE